MVEGRHFHEGIEVKHTMKTTLFLLLLALPCYAANLVYTLTYREVQTGQNTSITVPFKGWVILDTTTQRIAFIHYWKTPTGQKVFATETTDLFWWVPINGRAGTVTVLSFLNDAENSSFSVFMKGQNTSLYWATGSAYFPRTMTIVQRFVDAQDFFEGTGSLVWNKAETTTSSAIPLDSASLSYVQHLQNWGYVRY